MSRGNGKKLAVFAMLVLLCVACLGCMHIKTYIRAGEAEQSREAEGGLKPVDADAYFAQNGKLENKIPANESPLVLTEAEALALFTERGFGDYPITADYSMAGDYDPVEIQAGSGRKHPVYETYYVTERGDLWSILNIEGALLANPVFYNNTSARPAPLALSESGTVVSYDSVTNQFYKTVPDEAVLTVMVVGRIDSALLEELTAEEIDKR